MVLTHDRHRPGHPRGGGFSLLEVLVAAALLLIIAVGLLPLFTQAAISNTSGNDSTQVSNFARSRLEQFFQLPFNGPDLTIDSNSEKVFADYYSYAEERWKDGEAPPDELAVWARRTTVRQYGINALDDGVLQPDEALPAGTDATYVHLKEIEVAMTGLRGSGALGPAKQITLRVLKFK